MKNRRSIRIPKRLERRVHVKKMKTSIVHSAQLLHFTRGLAGAPEIDQGEGSEPTENEPGNPVNNLCSSLAWTTPRMYFIQEL